MFLEVVTAVTDISTNEIKQIRYYFKKYIIGKYIGEIVFR